MLNCFILWSVIFSKRIRIQPQRISMPFSFLKWSVCSMAERMDRKIGILEIMGKGGGRGEMPQTRRRLEKTAVRLVAPHRDEIADLIPMCDVLSRKSTCSQVSRRNLIPSGMSAPSMQLFDTWYFLFSLAHLRRAKSACDPHVAGALESLESEGNSLEDIWYGQKPGSVFSSSL